MFLTAEQLVVLTGYVQPAAQVRWLHSKRYHFFVRADGKPIVPPESEEHRMRREFEVYALANGLKHAASIPALPTPPAPTSSARTVAIMLGTPAWADARAIDKIYEECAERSKATGIRHEVDHIVPLCGKKVCGLHVENNLQILTAVENGIKSARWEP